jgi:hypothetical protein
MRLERNRLRDQALPVRRAVLRRVQSRLRDHPSPTEEAHLMNTQPSTPAAVVPTPAAAEHHRIGILPARHLRKPRGGTQHVQVIDPEHGPVSVRWRMNAKAPYDCAVCGQQKEARCPHTFSAALLLAERLLGLHRTEPYEPTNERNDNE